MNLAGFNFTKISAEKMSDKPSNLKVNTSIDISNIEEVKPAIFTTKETILGVKFSYILDYEKDFAKLTFEGNILLAVEPKIAKEVLKQWKEKKMPEDFRLSLFNFILRKANVKAIQLEDEMNLPLHMQMPKLGASTKEEKKE